MSEFALVVAYAFAAVVGVLVGKFVKDAAQSFWSLRHFNGPPSPSFFIGHLNRDMTQNKTVQVLRQWANQYSPIFKVRIGFLRTFLVVSHPDTVKALLSRSDPKEKWIYPILEPWLGGSIVLANGKKWQVARKLQTPAFHPDVLRSYMRVYNECTQKLIGKWLSEDGKICEIYDDLKRLTFDVLMRCIFSIDTESLAGGGNPYLQAVEELGQILVRRATSVCLNIPPLFTLTYARKFHKLCEIVHDYSRKVIAERKLRLASEKLERRGESGSWQRQESRKRIDFIDILLNSVHEDGTPVSDDEIQPEVDMFMFAGHDTTTSCLTWLLFHLASRQDYQRRCREEVQQVLRNASQLGYSDLNNLPYLTQCVKESLRMCPPVPYIGRELVEALVLDDGRVIPAGTTVYCAITLLHYNATVWPNPDVYDPSRFDAQLQLASEPSRSPFAFVPFSAGAHNCIGTVFAMNAMKVTAALLLAKFNFTIDVSRDFRFMHEMTIRPRDGMYLLIRPNKLE